MAVNSNISAGIGQNIPNIKLQSPKKGVIIGLYGGEQNEGSI